MTKAKQETQFARLRRYEIAERARSLRLARERHKPGGQTRQLDVASTLEDIADEFGLTRERIRQIEARALHRLLSAEHRFSVERRLDEAIAEWKAAKASGSETRMYWAIHNVDTWLDALTWLEEVRDGTLREHLREAEMEGEAPVYVGGFKASGHTGLAMWSFGIGAVR
jgi:hypothetical protein